MSMPEEDTSFDTPHEINMAIRESLKKTRALKITDMAGMNSIAVGLNEVAKITVEGTAGDYFGAFNGAATLRLIGDAGHYCGDTMSGGTIRVEGNAGYGTGCYLMGGTLNVEGNVGPAAGQRMFDGAIAIKGDAGSLSGLAMKGGMIFVGGTCGEDAGHNMEGGVIYARSFESLGKNAIQLPLNKVDKSRLIEYLDIDELEIDEFKKVVAEESKIAHEESFPVVLDELSERYLERLTLAPSFTLYDREDMEKKTDVDLSFKVGSGLGTLKSSVPLIFYDMGNTSPIMLKEADDLKISIITNEIGEGGEGSGEEEDEVEEEGPRAYRILRILPDREGVTIDTIEKGRGLELVLGTGSTYALGGELISPDPERALDINTPADLINFIELLREITKSAMPIFITVSGENIYDLIVNLAKGKPDGIILKSQAPTVALTLAMEALEDADKKDEIALLVIGDFTKSEEAYKLIAMGARGIALVFPEKGTEVKDETEAFSLKQLVEGIRVLMAYAGHTSLSEITQDDLRALDYSTAAATGVKLIGYDQKLPIWRR